VEPQSRVLVATLPSKSAVVILVTEVRFQWLLGTPPMKRHKVGTSCSKVVRVQTPTSMEAEEEIFISSAVWQWAKAVQTLAVILRCMVALLSRVLGVR
jgi:hypothetical protein